MAADCPDSIDFAPGVELSLSELLRAVATTKPRGDGTLELFDGNGRHLATATEALWRRLSPSKIYDYGGPEHCRFSADMDRAMSVGDVEAMSVAAAGLSRVKPPPRS